jgi:predicted ATP-grasp superfamily ATP-dependent carboligase
LSDLTIVGASARAAAGSALRAGLVPWTADLFADTDLRAMVPGAVRCPANRYPRVLLDILRDGPPGPWMYTGGLENHPNLVRQMAEVRPLWGNGPNALVACRSPFTVGSLLRESGLPVPEVRAAGAELPEYCRWLRKPLAGSAGHGIAFAATRENGVGSHFRGGNDSRPFFHGHYYQQFVPGASMSAVYVRARGVVRLLGITEQLIGEEWLNAPPFRYAGNVGPVRPSAELRNDLQRVGEVLGERCELLGLYGVDFVFHDGRPWVVEVNPRYPASVEVLELTTGEPAITLHRMAFDLDAEPGPHTASQLLVAGKAVLYAPQRIVMPSYDPRVYSESLGARVRAARHLAPIHFADIPAPGEVIERDWPVLTIFAEAENRDRCLAQLRDRAERVRRLLFGGQPEPMRSHDRYVRLDD